MTIQQVKALGVDMPVQAVKGYVTRIQKRYAGSKKDGTSYSLQKLELSDDTGKITVLLDGRDAADPRWLDQEIYIEGKHGQKGWMGLKTKDDVYRDKSEFVLKATAVAEITLAGESAGEPPNEERAQADAGLAPAAGAMSKPQQELLAKLIASGVDPDVARATVAKVAPLPQKAQEQNQAPNAPAGNQNAPTKPTGSAAPPVGAGQAGGTPVGQAKVAALQAASLYVVAFDAATWAMEVCQARHAGFVMSPEHFQAVCATLYITLDRMGCRVQNAPPEWEQARQKAAGAQG